MAEPVVTRAEFDALVEKVEDIAKRLEQPHPLVDAHEIRLDDHGRQLDELRPLVAHVGRLADIATKQGLALTRIERHTSRVLEILEPRTVVVEPAGG